ncbi:MAG TPA: methyltransferase domain-containing protein [Gaiellaceae bacterium]|nr:methyltransferase domain-containing protein [Gaiellaceae bacterium]
MSSPPDSLATERFWREYWQTHDPVQEVGRDFYFASLLDRALARSNARSFLELGGYPGHFAVYVAKRFGLAATLLDSYVDRDVVERLLARNGLAAEDVTVIEEDMFAAEPRQRYDVVLSAGLLEHFLDLERVLKRHLDFLAPGGILVVTVPNYRGVNGRLQARFDPAHLAAHNLEAMDPERLRELLVGLGLEAVEVGYYGRFRVWLEDLGRRPPPVRATVYAIQALGLPLDLVGFRSRWTSPHVAAVARARP